MVIMYISACVKQKLGSSHLEQCHLLKLSTTFNQFAPFHHLEPSEYIKTASSRMASQFAQANVTRPGKAELECFASSHTMLLFLRIMCALTTSSRCVVNSFISSRGIILNATRLFLFWNFKGTLNIFGQWQSRDILFKINSKYSHYREKQDFSYKYTSKFNVYF